jgi:hypothetical protein
MIYLVNRIQQKDLTGIDYINTLVKIKELTNINMARRNMTLISCSDRDVSVKTQKKDTS